MDFNNISQSYLTEDPSDRIRDLINLPCHFATLEEVRGCQIATEEIGYLLRIAECPYVETDGDKFTDLFPDDAIASYHDDHNRPLPRFRITSGKDGEVLQSSWLSFAVRKEYELSEQKQYLLFRLLPKFSTWLVRFLALKLQCEREATSNP